MNNNNNNNNKITILKDVKSEFRNDVLKDALKLNFTNAKCKINDEAVILLNETLKAMLVETVLRASEPPNEPKRLNITLDAVEKVLPQIIFDFS